MKNLSVIELSKLYKINRQTIYNHINKGVLSKNSDGKIDLSEAIRVFGEPSKKNNVKENVKLDSKNSAENLLLRQQVDILKSQLSDAKEREGFYQNQIETMQRLLEAPKLHSNDQDILKESINSKTEEVIQEEKKDYTVSEAIKEKPKQRGFWSRFFLPNG